MKKLLCLMLLLFPSIVFADMSAPLIPEFEAIIVNDNGIDCGENHYEKGDIVTVYGYLDFYLNSDSNGDEYFLSNNNCNITKKDFIPKDYTYNMDDNRLEKPITGKVLNKNGVKMYSGPSDVFEEITTIPYDTDINLIANSFETPYYYIEYNNEKGWINSINCSVGTPSSDKIITFVEIKIDDIKIPIGEKFDVLYASDNWSRKSYIKYKDNYYWVSDYDVLHNYGTDVSYKSSFEKNTIIFDNLTSKKIIEEIPAGTEVEIMYSNYGSGEGPFYVKYNDIVGFVDMIDYDDIDHHEETTTMPQSTKSTTKKANAKNDVNYVPYYIIGGICLSLTAIVTVILINKKRG